MTTKFQLNFKLIPTALRGTIAKLVQDQLVKMGYSTKGLITGTLEGVVTGQDAKMIILNNIDDCNVITWNYTEPSINGGTVYHPINDWDIWTKFVYTTPVITVELNSEYTAVVSLENVKVGCQTFSFDKIANLMNAVNKQIINKSRQ